MSSATFDNVALTTPPTALADAYTTNGNATLNVAAPGVLSNDTDPESDALSAVLVSGTPGLTLNANGSFATGTLTYTLAGGAGSATAIVKIHDNGGTANGCTDTSALQSFTITVVANARPFVTATSANLSFTENGSSGAPSRDRRS